MLPEITIPLLVIGLVIVYMLILGYVIGFFIGCYIQRGRDVEKWHKGESPHYHTDRRYEPPTKSK